jgi:predicted transposase/invertase (TIGR01784 family)
MDPIAKFLNPKNDLAFKRIFGTEKNKDILLHFLNDIFERKDNPIEEVTFLKTFQEPEVASNRVSIVDILCRDHQGNRFIVEMQVANEGEFEKRAQYYAAKAYIQQREKGMDYKDLKAATFLAITAYTLFPDKKAYLSHHHILDIDTHDHAL